MAEPCSAWTFAWTPTILYSGERPCTARSSPRSAPRSWPSWVLRRRRRPARPGTRSAPACSAPARSSRPATSCTSPRRCAPRPERRADRGRGGLRGRAHRTRVTIIVDENPSPVAAQFDIGGKRDRLKLATLMRLNAATDVRVIVEASDGALYMAERFVKFAGGQAACSAPPSGTPELIAANMGKMTFEQPRQARRRHRDHAAAPSSRSATPTTPAWCSTS